MSHNAAPFEKNDSDTADNIQRTATAFDEPEELLRAIREERVDAFVVRGVNGDRIFTVTTADRRYRVFVEAMNEAAVTLAADGTIVYCNGRFGEMLETSVPDLMGTSFAQIVVPEQRLAFHDLFHRSQRAPSKESMILVATSGRQIRAEISARAFVDGGIPGIAVVIRDETEYRQAQEALERSSEHVRLLLDSTAEAISGIDMSGKCTFVNAAWLRLLGYSDADGILGRDMNELVGPKNASAEPGVIGACSIMAAMERGESTHSRNEMLWRNDGSSFPVECWCHPIKRGGKLLGAVVTFLDISGEREQEHKTARAEAILEATPDLVAISAGFDQPIEYMNKAGRRLIGLKDTDDISALLPSQFFSSTDAALMRDSVLTTAMRLGVWSGEATLLALDGKRIPVSQVVLCHRDSNAKEYFSVIIRDLTEHKALEAQLRQAQKMEAIGRLAGGVAHDFNNVLTVILGYCSMLTEAPYPIDEGVLRRYIASVKSAGERAAALTCQLLAFSRKQLLQPVVLNINDTLAKLESFLRRLIGEDIELLVIRDPDLRSCRVDQGQLEQVIMNIVVNARDAMPKGGNLTIETIDSPPAHATLVISDTGCGMTEDTLAHLFEPFFTTKERGTGLGLPTVYGIVTQSGGDIKVLSEAGKGSTFRISFPTIMEGAQPRQSSSEEVSPGGTETILVVEDEDEVRDMTAAALRGKGYTVLDARGGGEALEIASKHRIDLVITDVVMPRMGGREFAEQLQAIKPNTRVLYISGYTDDAVLHYGLLTTKIQFLQKPFSLDELFKKVRTVLETSTT